MSIILTRIDDRLVHGQVTVGWVQSLQIDHIIVCDNSLAVSEWERNLYMECVPASLRVTFITEEEYVQNEKETDSPTQRIIFLVESPEVLVRLVKGGAHFPAVNVGGMHYKDNSRELLPYVFVSPSDIKAFKFLEKQNITITCQDTPAARKHPLGSLLAKISGRRT